MDDIQLASQQQKAFENIQKWYESDDQQWYYLGGWAGTGKTTMARRLAQELVGLNKTIFAAFTGKAAYRLKECGCPTASTMHSFIYTSREKSQADLLQHKKDLEALTKQLEQENNHPDYIAAHPGVQRLEGLIYQEEQNLRRPMFKLNHDSLVRDMPLSVLDEVSMVNNDMGKDWLSFGQKTLVLGDPFQLPPVAGEGYFTRNDPHFMLTEIHRQAEGNPIIQLATLLRRSQMPRLGQYGKSRVVRRSDLTQNELRDIVLASDQIIVGKNATRHAYNNRMRMLNGFKERYPMAGEPLVCLRNNHEKGLLNGAIYEVVERLDVFEDLERISLRIRPQGGGQDIDVDSHLHHFLGKEEVLQKMWMMRRDAEEFDYGYALTCHKTQGSQFRNPVIFDESYIAREHKWRWLYTAMTRAIEGATLVLQG